MSIFVFSKGIATISTIGGALLGGYFATTSLDKGNTEQLEVTEVGHSGNSSLGEDGLVSPKQQDVEENKQGAAEVQATPIIQENDSSEVTESKNNELNEPQQDSQVSENVDSESSGGDYQQDSGIQESQDIQLTDPTLVEALRDTKDYTTSSNNDEEEQDQKDLDSGEQFEDFEEDEEDIFDDEDDVESSLIMAEYIKTWSENSDSSKQGPTRQKWIRLGRNGHQIKEEENCEGLMNRKLGENKNLLLSWMDVEQSKDKKVLKYYGLWNSDSKFTNNKRKSWKSGNWSCSRQFSGKDRFAITCDYYR